MTSNPPPQLRPMSEFDPFEPAILHDRYSDKIVTWTGEDASDFCSHAIATTDGAAQWREFVFDGWGNVMGG
jgi:hypothetical protein